jgi:parvulin-like peptidyl-prolyl isomerase
VSGLGCTPRASDTPSPQPQSQSVTPTASDRPATPTVAPTTAPRTITSDVIATIDTLSITREDLEAPLFAGYGLNMLIKVAQLKIVRAEVQKQGLMVTEKDVNAERERYLKSLFNEEKDPDLLRLNTELEQAEKAKDEKRAQAVREDLARERNVLLEQLLQQQKLSRADFDLFIETSTYLRALAQVRLAKTPITEEALRAAFNHLYGEKIQVRDIQLGNLQEATEAKRRLAAGEDFATVAREMSRDPAAAQLGGELPPFSRETPGLPQQFKDVAFALQKEGEISDPVEAEGSYHIVQLKRRIPPNKVIKFDDVKDSVREFLVEKQLESLMKDLRAALGRDVVTSMKINEPILRQQFEKQTTKREEELRDRNDIRRQLDRKLQQQREATTRPSASGAATQPATAPATSKQ